jgi:PAS domain S-box-containing protein
VKLPNENELLENLLNNAQVAIVIADSNQIIMRINPEFTRLFGYSENDAIGKNIYNLLVPDKLRAESKQVTKRLVTLKEIEAVLEAPNPTTWSGRRDRALLTTLYNTGARVSEIVNIKCIDIEGELCTGLHLHGKGRKERVVPLWKRTSRILRQWLPQIEQSPHSPIFPNRMARPSPDPGWKNSCELP